MRRFYCDVARRRRLPALPRGCASPLQQRLEPDREPGRQHLEHGRSRAARRAQTPRASSCHGESSGSSPVRRGSPPGARRARAGAPSESVRRRPSGPRSPWPSPTVASSFVSACSSMISASGTSGRPRPRSASSRRHRAQNSVRESTRPAPRAQRVELGERVVGQASRADHTRHPRCKGRGAFPRTAAGGVSRPPPRSRPRRRARPPRPLRRHGPQPQRPASARSRPCRPARRAGPHAARATTPGLRRRHGPRKRFSLGPIPPTERTQGRRDHVRAHRSPPPSRLRCAAPSRRSGRSCPRHRRLAEAGHP